MFRPSKATILPTRWTGVPFIFYKLVCEVNVRPLKSKHYFVVGGNEIDLIKANFRRLNPYVIIVGFLMRAKIK